MEKPTTTRAIFHERQQAVAAVDRLLDAHVPASDIDLYTSDGATVPIRHRNHMARSALLGGVVGLGVSMLWLAAGASGWIDMPVMASIIDTVGLVGTGLRLSFLGMAVGVVAGALGGLRTRVQPIDDRHHMDRADQIIVDVARDSDEAMAALQASGPAKVLSFPERPRR